MFLYVLLSLRLSFGGKNEFLPHKKVPVQDQDDSNQFGNHHIDAEQIDKNPNNYFGPKQTANPDDCKKREFFLDVAGAFENKQRVERVVCCGSGYIGKRCGKQVIYVEEMSQDKKHHYVTHGGSSATDQITEKLQKTRMDFSTQNFDGKKIYDIVD